MKLSCVDGTSVAVDVVGTAVLVSVVPSLAILMCTIRCTRNAAKSGTYSCAPAAVNQTTDDGTTGCTKQCLLFRVAQLSVCTSCKSDQCDACCA